MQDLVERAEGRLGLVLAVLAAHAVAVQPDVAVREVLRELLLHAVCCMFVGFV